MASSLCLLNPLDFPNWDETLLATPGSVFFHTSSWARVLCDTYRYTPCYLSEMEGSRFSTLVPVMEVRSILTGRRGVSLPFTDFCPPILRESSESQDLFRELVACAQRRAWKYIELRDTERLKLEESCSTDYLTHDLRLTPGVDTLFQSLKSNMRRNIRKAKEQGVEVQRMNTREGMSEYFKLHRMTRKRHGLPPQPYRFFGNVCDHIILKDLGSIFLSFHSGRPVAGAVFFHFGTRVVYKFGASDFAWQHLRANNLLMWAAIRWYCERGFSELNFGRTEPENDGLARFKAGWGATERIMHYHRYAVKKGRFVKSALRVPSWQKAIFGRMPPPLLDLAGALLYRHIG